MAGKQGSSTSPTTLRQRTYRKRMEAKGIKSVLLWVPVAAIPDLQLIAEMMRDNPNVMVRPYSIRSGKMLKMKQRPPLWPESDTART